MKTIPFQNRFKEPLLSGQKTATTRREAYGKPGEYFGAFGATFLITGVTKMLLKDVAHLHYKEEGVGEPEEFINVWVTLHPVVGYREFDEVYFHTFSKCEDPRDTLRSIELEPKGTS